jgi:serine protease DegQ
LANTPISGECRPEIKAMTVKRSLTLSAAVLLISAAASAQLPAFLGGEKMPSLAPLVEEVSPAVVNIRVSQTVT